MPNDSTTLTRLGNANFSNLKDFNRALGNGADATSALNAALAALGTNSGTILVPDGIYGISSRITYALAANQHIILEGEGNARFVSTVPEPGSEAGIFTFTGDSGKTAKLTFRRFKISHTNSGLGILDGIYVQPLNYGSGGTQSVASVLLEDVEVTGASRWGVNLIGALSVSAMKCNMSSNRDAGFNVIGCQNVTILGGIYSNNVTGALSGDYGITLASSSLIPPCKNVFIAGTQCNNNGRKGIDCHHGHNVHIIGNSCTGNGEIGIYAVMESSSKDVGDITISENTVDMAGSNATLTSIGVQIGTFGTTGALDAGAFIVSNNKIRNIDAGLANSHAIRVLVATSGVAPDRVIISGNTVDHGTGSTGFFVDTDNNLAIPHIEVTNNIFHTTSCAHGVIIQNATNALVIGNEIKVDSGTPSTGINVPSATNAVIMGNQINASPTTVISNPSSSTHLHRGNQQNGVTLADSPFPASTFALPLTVTGGLTIDANGHLLSTVSGTPTLTSINANVTNQSVSGNDVRGTLAFDVQTGTIATGTALFTVNFAVAYASAPIIMLTTGPSNQANNSFYVSADAAGTFTVRNGATLAVLTGYKVQYFVIG